jgi:hypothetical protein
VPASGSLNNLVVRNSSNRMIIFYEGLNQTIHINITPWGNTCQ